MSETERTKLFISYSHRDSYWLERLELHLALLEREKIVHVWSDTRTNIGDRWEKEIDKALTESKVAVLMITPAFLASNYIWGKDKEIDRILAHQPDMLVLPLITKPCAWRIAEKLAELQARPRDGRALSLGSDAAIDSDLAAFVYELAGLLGKMTSSAASDEADKTLRQNQYAVAYPARSLRGDGESLVDRPTVREEPSTAPASGDLALTVRELRTLAGHSEYVTAAAVTPDGQRAVSASGDTLKVWELDSGRELRTLAGHSEYVTAVAVTPDGQCAVSASWDRTLKVWHLGSGRELRTLTSHSREVTAVAVTPDGQRAVSASRDGTLKVWDLPGGRELNTVTSEWGQAGAVAVMPDGQRVVSASDDQTLKVWELASGRELRTLAGHTSPVHAVALTPDGQRALSASSDRTLRVWELASGRELRTLVGHSDSVLGVAVMPDGQRAVSASGDETLKVWDLATGRELATFKAGARLQCCTAFPDGKTFLAGDANGVLHYLRLR